MKPSRDVLMHDNQLVIGVDTARKLIEGQFPQFRGASIERLVVTGTENAIFRIGGEAVARFPLREIDQAARARELENEAAAMREFAGISPFAAPSPIGIGRPGYSYPSGWSVHTWLEGDAATPTSQASSTSLAVDLVRLLSTLRAADTRGRAFVGHGRGGALADQGEWIELCLYKSEGLLDVGALRRMWHSFRELPESEALVMSHKDLTPYNLLVKGGRLVGVLDTGGFGPADPALDLVAAWHLLDRSGREVMRSGLGSSRTEWQRGAAWAFQQAMGLVWYYRTSNPAMAELGSTTLARLVADSGFGP